MLELNMHEAKMLKEQGKKIHQIAEALGKSERMVHYYLSEPTRTRKKREYPSKLDPFKPYLDTILEDDPTFNREVLHENLRKQKYDGGITILRDYAAKKSAEISRKAVIRFETEPGYQAQVDWKILGNQFMGGTRQKLYAFVMVLGFSRKPFVIHTTSMDQSTVLMCHVLAFHYLGGVPKEILYDNMKTAFIYSAETERWIPNKQLLSMAQHYGFIPRRCQVRRPQTKGKVERFIHYYENNFWIPNKSLSLTIDELNAEVFTWVDRICDRTIGGLNESRHQRFDYEKSCLSPLPVKAFDCRSNTRLRVSREARIRVRNNWYSVPPEYIGENLTVRIDPLSFETFVYSDEQKLVRRFALYRKDRNQRFFLSEHSEALSALWRKQYSTPKRRRRVQSKTAVVVRSPQEYEKLFTLGEAS